MSTLKFAVYCQKRQILSKTAIFIFADSAIHRKKLSFLRILVKKNKNCRFCLKFPTENLKTNCTFHPFHSSCLSYTFTILVLTQHKVISYKEIRLTGKNSWSGKGEKCSLFSSFNPQNQSNWINQTTLKQLNKGVGTQHKEGINSYNSSCGLAFWLDTLWNISYNQELIKKHHCHLLWFVWLW